LIVIDSELLRQSWCQNVLHEALDETLPAIVSEDGGSPTTASTAEAVFLLLNDNGTVVLPGALMQRVTTTVALP